jgi:3-methylcrotonyl-CoA carboxylase alpha subunit
MRTGVFTVRYRDDEHRVAVSPAGEARVDDGAALEVTATGGGAFRVREGGRSRQAFVVARGAARQVFVEGEVYEFTVDDGPPSPSGARRGRPGRGAPDAVTSPMPAKVTAILVEPGSQVNKGEVLLKLEAMKMELPVRAPHDGTVKAVLCRAGELVQPGVPLVELS